MFQQLLEMTVGAREGGHLVTQPLGAAGQGVPAQLVRTLCSWVRVGGLGMATQSCPAPEADLSTEQLVRKKLHGGPVQKRGAGPVVQGEGRLGTGMGQVRETQSPGPTSQYPTLLLPRSPS
jgi:hypothetical protein